jgi:hypothetical protein
VSVNTSILISVVHLSLLIFGRQSGNLFITSVKCTSAYTVMYINRICECWVLKILSRVLGTKDGVQVGNWIY